MISAPTLSLLPLEHSLLLKIGCVLGTLPQFSNQKMFQVFP